MSWFPEQLYYAVVVDNTWNTRAQLPRHNIERSRALCAVHFSFRNPPYIRLHMIIWTFPFEWFDLEYLKYISVTTVDCDLYLEIVDVVSVDCLNSLDIRLWQKVLIMCHKIYQETLHFKAKFSAVFQY